MGPPVTEASYTAWDGNLYEWPPPDGWYEAADGKWWPEGYGPSDGEGSGDNGNGAGAGAAVDTPAPAEPAPTAGNGVAATPAPEAAAGQDDDDDEDELPDISDLFGGEDIFADDDSESSSSSSSPEGGDAAAAATTPAAADEVAASAPADADDVEPVPEATSTVDEGPAQSSADDQLAEVTSIGMPAETPAVATPEPAEVASGFGVTPTYDDGPEAFTSSETDRDPAPDPTAFSGGMLLNDQGGGHPGGGYPGGRADPYGRGASGYATDYDDGDGYGETMVDDRYGGRGQLLDDPGDIDGHGEDDYRQAAAYQDDDGGRTNWPLAVAGACLAALIALLVIYLLTRGGGDDIDTAPPASAVSGPGSINEPYALGTDVAVYYDDDQGVQSRWVVKVLSPVVDGTGTLAEARNGQLPDGQALAVTQVRLTYESGPAPGEVADLLFNAVGDSGTVYDPANNGCGTVAEPVSLDTQLQPGQFFEGNLCWQVASADLASLKLAMEAVPAEGRIHLVLN